MPISLKLFDETFLLSNFPEDVTEAWITENLTVLDAEGRVTHPGNPILERLIRAAITAEGTVGTSPHAELQDAIALIDGKLNDLRFDVAKSEISDQFFTIAGGLFAIAATGGTAGLAALTSTALAITNGLVTLSDTQKRYATFEMMLVRAETFAAATQFEIDLSIEAFSRAYADPTNIDAYALLDFQEHLGRAGYLLQHARGAAELSFIRAAEDNLSNETWISPTEADAITGIPGSALGYLAQRSNQLGSTTENFFKLPANLATLATIFQTVDTFFFSETDEARIEMEQQIAQMPDVGEAKERYDVFSSGEFGDLFNSFAKAYVPRGTEGDDVISNIKAFGVSLNALGGDDEIAGSNGADALQGGSGSDTIRSGLGNDSLYGGQDADVLEGGPDNDWYQLTEGDVAIDTSGNDYYQLIGAGEATIRDYEGTNQLTLPGGVAELRIDLEGDHLAASNASGARVVIEDFAAASWRINGIGAADLIAAIAADADQQDIGFANILSAYEGDAAAPKTTRDQINVTSNISAFDNLVGVWDIEVDTTTNPDGLLNLLIADPITDFTAPHKRELSLSLFDPNGALLAQAATSEEAGYYQDFATSLPELSLTGLISGTYTLTLEFNGFSGDLSVDLWTWQSDDSGPVLEAGEGGPSVPEGPEIELSPYGSISTIRTREDELLVYSTSEQTGLYSSDLGLYNISDGTLIVVDGIDIEGDAIQIGNHMIFEGISDTDGTGVFATDGTFDGTGLLHGKSVEVVGQVADRILLRDGDLGIFAYDPFTGEVSNLMTGRVSETAFNVTMSSEVFVIGDAAYFSVRTTDESGGESTFAMWYTDGTWEGTQAFGEQGIFGNNLLFGKTSEQLDALIWSESIDDDEPRAFYGVLADQPGELQNFGSATSIDGSDIAVPAGFFPTSEGVVFSESEGSKYSIYFREYGATTDQLVFEIDRNTDRSNLSVVETSGPVTYFTLETDSEGTELYAFDGTAVTQISNAPGVASGYDTLLTTSGGQIVFTDDSEKQLWLSDGTSDGTTLINELDAQTFFTWTDAAISGDTLYADFNVQALATFDITNPGLPEYKLVPAPFEFVGSFFGNVIALPLTDDRLVVSGSENNKYGLWLVEPESMNAVELPGFDQRQFQVIDPNLAFVADVDPSAVPGPATLFFAVTTEAREGGSFELVVNRPERVEGEITVTWIAGGGELPSMTGNLIIPADDAFGLTEIEVPLDIVTEGAFEPYPVKLLSAEAGGASTPFSSDVKEVFVSEAADANRPIVSISDARAAEGSALVFDLSLDSAVTFDVEVLYQITLLTADEADVALPENARVVIPSGETMVGLSVPVVADMIFEGPEVLRVRLLGTVGDTADVEAAAAFGTIEANTVFEDGDLLQSSSAPVFLDNLNNEVSASTGGNTIFGLGGDDTVTGDDGDDRLNGDAGMDLLLGGAGRDTLTGGSEADTLSGGADFDLITTGAGTDLVTGPLLELVGDRITDFSQNDILRIEDIATTTARVSPAAGSVLLTLGENGDGMEETAIRLDGDFSKEVFMLTFEGGRTEISLAPSGAVRLSASGERFVTADEGPNQVFGEGGADFVLAGGGADLVFGGAGSDVLLGSAGNDTLAGGAGNDELTGGAGADDFVISANDFDGFGVETITDFTPGEDKLVLNGFGDINFITLSGGVSIDTGTGAIVLLEGLAESELNPGDIVQGPPLGFALTALAEVHNLTAASDRFVTTDTGPNVVHAGDGADSVLTSGGADLLMGEGGSDFLLAGAGDDTVVGGTGNDILGGGSGADRFEFMARDAEFTVDTITDFELGTDVVGLSGYGAPTLLELSGSGAAQLSATEFIMFEGIALEALEAEPVVFEFT